MPWSEKPPMSERRRFIDEYLRGSGTIVISVRATASAASSGTRGSRDSWSRATARWRTALLITARRRHPTWGPRKILDSRRPRHGMELPATSTVGALFKRHGLVRPKRRRPQPGHPGRPTTRSSLPMPCGQRTATATSHWAPAFAATRSRSSTGTPAFCSRARPSHTPRGPEYPSHYLTRYVSTNGGVRFHNRYITVAPARIGEHIGLQDVADGRWAI